MMKVVMEVRALERTPERAEKTRPRRLGVFGRIHSWRGRARATTLFAAAAALLLLSLFLPYWTIRLFAPQYPQGLTVTVYLTHAGGDVREVDLLNHYIGMASLGDAAAVERRMGVLAIAIAALGLPVIHMSGRKVTRFLPIPAVLFPFVFIGDLYVWLARYGHTLNPHAPIHVDPFTPVLFGQGVIAQFRTVSAFGPGFYLALAAAALAVAGAVFRQRFCDACALADQCQFVCLSLRGSSP